MTPVDLASAIVLGAILAASVLADVLVRAEADGRCRGGDCARCRR